MFAASQIAIPRRRSLVIWALFALFMVVTSYVVAIGIAVACLSLVLVGYNSVLLAVGGLILGLTILWSLFPRRDRFLPPGSLLQRSRHPRLFAELDRIAASLNEELPGEVYLIPDVNAWVAERGGVIGVGSRRVMALGLPLLGVLSVAQFRAVLAHEFAHYYGGDTRLGPWVYRTRAAMARTFQALGEPSALLGALARFAVIALLYQLVVFLLVAYWKLFLRCTQLISRRQEYRADELACTVAGPQALINGLRAINRTGPVVQTYWQAEVAPVMSAGFRPPIAEGFASFVSAPAVSTEIDALLDRQLREEKTQAFDSHPPLRDRIARANQYAWSDRKPESGEDAPAFTLVDDLGSAELELLQLLSPALQNKQLTPVAWDGIKASVVTRGWKESVAQFSALLQPILVSDLPSAVRNPAWIGSQIPDPQGMLLTREQRNRRAQELLGIALGLVMMDHSWIMVANPGEFHLARDRETVSPIGLVFELASGKISADAWLERASDLGIASCSLAKQTAENSLSAAH